MTPAQGALQRRSVMSRLQAMLVEAAVAVQSSSTLTVFLGILEECCHQRDRCGRRRASLCVFEDDALRLLAKKLSTVTSKYAAAAVCRVCSLGVGGGSGFKELAERVISVVFTPTVKFPGKLFANTEQYIASLHVMTEAALRERTSISMKAFILSEKNYMMKLEFFRVIDRQLADVYLAALLNLVVLEDVRSAVAAFTALAHAIIRLLCGIHRDYVPPSSDVFVRDRVIARAKSFDGGAS